MADIVSRLTEPGELVVDPFVGGGTTAIVCRDLGRRFVGCDVDPKATETTRRRLAA
jgi:DNA modification methylase